MQTRYCISLFLLPLSLTLANVARAQPEYRVTVMGPASSEATDINNAGVVVGTYSVNGANRAFLNRGKGVVDLGTLGGTSSKAVALNDKGEVLGHWIAAGAERRGFIYYRGKQRDIGVAPKRANAIGLAITTVYTDINNAGYVTMYEDSYNVPGRGFLRSPKGEFTDIGALPYKVSSTAPYALNNKNQITGDSGPKITGNPFHELRTFIWTKGGMREFGDPTFARDSGRDINDRGQVTGSGWSRLLYYYVERAFLYSNGRLIDIDGRPAAASTFSYGTGINNRGHVIGTSDHLKGFIYRGRRMESLNALIDPKLGWTINSPKAINDAGQIAATGSYNGKSYAVRLDLIRPSAAGMPELELDEASASSAMSPKEAEADARAEAEAQAREVVRPVGVEE